MSNHYNFMKLRFLCFAILLWVGKSFEISFDTSDKQLHNNITFSSISSSFVSLGNEEAEMVQNFNQYIDAQISETNGVADGMICEGNNAVEEAKYAREYAYLCYNENAVPDCTMVTKVTKRGETKQVPIFTGQVPFKKGSGNNFKCNKPCGCWIGEPEVKTATLNIEALPNNWEDVEAKLKDWNVPAESLQQFKEGFHFDGAGFQNFNTFFRSGNSAEYSMACGSTRVIGDKVQIGYMFVDSKCWLADKWKTKIVPAESYEQVCEQQYDFDAKSWREHCQMQNVLKGYTRAPANKGPEALQSDEVIKITAALQNVAFKQLKEKI